MNTIRIANGQGFWGDSLDAPIEQVRRGPIDYLTLDYLAEITMSIMQKQRARDPVIEVARRRGFGGRVRVGIVAGDDIMHRLDDFIARGVELQNLDTGEPLASIRPLVQSANVYFGG